MPNNGVEDVDDERRGGGAGDAPVAGSDPGCPCTRRWTYGRSVRLKQKRNRWEDDGPELRLRFDV